MNMPVRKLPPLNALRAFEAAARHLSFNAAALELCVTPAAISHQIKTLESFLGVDLFKRVKRRVVLTEPGQLILPELKQAFALIEHAFERLQPQSGANLLTVSASAAFTARWLLPRIHLFQQHHPEIDIRLDANQDLADLENDGVDVAIRFGNGDYPGLESRPLRSLSQESMFPVCSPALQWGEHPIYTPEDLRYHTLLHDDSAIHSGILPDWGKWISTADLQGVNTNRGLRFNNGILALEAAINGQGVALVCSFVVADDIRAGRLVRPFQVPCTLEYNYYVVFAKHQTTTKVEKFYHWLQAMCLE